MQTTAARQTVHDTKEEPRRFYRIERQFNSQRQLRELVRDLLRAHSGA